VQSGGIGQHPVDQLIRELVTSGRPATADEVQQILDRLATAPFDPRVLPVRPRHQSLAYQGRTLGSHAPALFLHLTLRVVEDQQWALGTTESEYLTDLRSAPATAGARLLVYHRRGGAVAAVLAANLLASSRLGPAPEPWLYVVYSADRGTILSGYQASGVQALSIPEDARWLK
jgi:hypothetical protein